jgi:hemolysin activation/secretion protein
VVLQGSDSLNTPIEYVPLAAEYSSTRQNEQGSSEVGVGITLGLRGVLGNQEQEFADKRYKASANYFSLRLRLGATQKLPGGFSLASRLDSQLASGPLISSEQFAAGGQESVRGYREAEALGDDGFRASLELRRPFPAAWTKGRFDEFYGLGFLEAAKLWVRDPLPDQTDRFSLVGAGIGLRAKLQQGFRLGLDLAHAFRDGVYTLKGDSRAHFSVVYEF